MDRFIETVEYNPIENYSNLKSNMDRFIGYTHSRQLRRTFISNPIWIDL